MVDVIECAKSVISSEIAGLTESLKLISDDFKRAVDLLFATKGHVIVSGMGKPGHIGKKISATLASTGTPSFFLHPAEASHGDLGEISKDDVLLVLSLSGETSELFPMLEYSKRFGIKIISVTANLNSTLAKLSDFVIQIPKLKEACPNNLAPTTSSTIMLAIGDAIAVCLLELRNFSKDDFKALHPGGSLGKKLLKVSDLMHSNVPIATENERMSDVLIQMTKMAFGCIGVIDSHNNLVGIITDGDLRRHITDNILEKTAAQTMTVSPITVSDGLFAAEAIKIMNDKQITSLFVTKDSKPIGILHIHDCLRAGIA